MLKRNHLNVPIKIVSHVTVDSIIGFSITYFTLRMLVRIFLGYKLEQELFFRMCKGQKTLLYNVKMSLSRT